MKICIPRLGQEIVLTKAWKFKLKSESRNQDAIALLGESPTLKKGTTLKVDRIYIRAAGVKAFEYDSVTFKMPVGTPVKRQCRFFVSVSDANSIECNSAGAIKEKHSISSRFYKTGDYCSKSALLRNVENCRRGCWLFSTITPEIPKRPDDSTWADRGLWRKYQSIMESIDKKMIASGKSYMSRNGITFSNMLEHLPDGVEYKVRRFLCEIDKDPVKIKD